MTAREDILAAVPAVCARIGQDVFTPQDVIDELERRGTGYKRSTIRAHIMSRSVAGRRYRGLHGSAESRRGATMGCRP